MDRYPTPSFFCLGAQKAGTTTLHNILKQHPDIYLPPAKEAQFFDVNERYEKGLEYYFTEFFSTYNGEPIVGNINPNLQLETRSIERLIDSFGTNIKCIFIIREPVARAYSHYLMSKRTGYEDLGFLEAISAEQERINNPTEHTNYNPSKEPGHYEKNHWGYIYRSKYLKTIKYLYEKLPDQNVKVLVFEEFISNRKKVTEEVLTFIQAPLNQHITYSLQSNAASSAKSSILRDLIYKPNPFKKVISHLLGNNVTDYVKEKIISLNSRKLDQDEKTLSKKNAASLYNKYFREDVRQLEEFLNIRLDSWKNKYS